MTARRRGASPDPLPNATCGDGLVADVVSWATILETHPLVMARVRREARNRDDETRWRRRRRSMSPAIRLTPRRELAARRRPRRHPCWGHVIAAPLWPLHGANLGTLLRTCDAVGACMAVPPHGWVNDALARGNTLRHPTCIHRVGNPPRWLEAEKQTGTRILGVELADEAVRLGDLPAARHRTIAVLGHEQTGIPPEILDLLDAVVEIPMIGTGTSLNVAVAGSLVLYKLAGML